MKTWVRNLLILLVFTGGSSTACTPTLSGETVPAQTPSVTVASTVSATTTPALNTSVRTPSMNVVSPAPATITPAAVAPEFHFDASCWPIRPLAQGNDIAGSLIYAYHALPKVNRLFAWDIGTFREMPLKVDFKLYESMETYVSPDGSYLIGRSGKKEMKLLSRDGVRSLPLPHEYVFTEGFLLDGRILLVDTQNRADNYREGRGFTDIYYLLDPASGEITKHSVFLPAMQQALHHMSAVHYSPDMRYVLYQSDHKKRKKDVEFTLYDLEKNEIVWIGPARGSNLVNAGFTVPAWRPDASALTNVYIDKNGSNYYSISLDGKVSPITAFDGANLFTTQSSGAWSGYKEFANWSPGGRYLALSGSQKGDEDQRMGSLYIWDDQEKTAYRPCLPDEEKRFLKPFYIHWSFDGSYILHYLCTLRIA